MIAARHEIIQYIPQRNPVVMIHELIEASERHAVTRFSVEESNVFVSEGHLTEPGLVENMAQTVAAQSGYNDKKSNKPVTLGYIAAVKNLVIGKLPEVNTMIETTIQVVNQVLNVIIVEGKVVLNGKTICSCELRIFKVEP